MAITLSNAENIYQTASATTIKDTISVSGGALLVVSVGHADKTEIVQSVTDTAGHTYKHVAGLTGNSGNDVRHEIWYTYNTTKTDNNEVTVTFDVGADYRNLSLLEFSGCAIDTDPFDISGQNTQIGGTRHESSVTTTEEETVVVHGNSIWFGNKNYSVDSPWTFNGDSTSVLTGTEYRIFTSSGTLSGALITSASCSSVNNIAAFKAAAAAPAGTNMQVNIGDTWKEVSAAKINVGDTWKDVSSASVNVGDTWKTIF